MACAWLLDAAPEHAELPKTLSGAVKPQSWKAVSQLAASGSCLQTTSMGRLFDAIAALCGLRATINYEGQAAIELEASCDPRERDSYPMAVSPGELLMIDPRETLRSVLADLSRGVSVGAIASRFHSAIGRVTVQACSAIASERHCETVVLAGGTFANRRLLAQVASELAAAGLRVLTPRRLPPGDGAISYGQAAVAAARLTP
jgi:hydrogenase maturation protein HypF